MKSSEITIDLAINLIKKQFPNYFTLPIMPVDKQGHDNRTFRLGDKMLIRMPSAVGYASKVKIEQEWLPKLAPFISLGIPTPLHRGKPSADYPYHWSIYKWIDGVSLDFIAPKHLDLEKIAQDLAYFIKELFEIDTVNAPEAGKHNFYRGCHPRIYDQATRNYIEKLKSIIDSKKALEIWEVALNSRWDKKPVWIHGDLSIANILLKSNKIKAIIDFGGMAIGDPACDLVLYWNFFNGKSQDIFRSEINLNQNTWDRAKGWALWKACFEVVSNKDFKSKKALKWTKFINEVLL